MAAHTWKYPTVAAVTNTLTFNDGTTGIARLQEDTDEYQFNDEMGTTKGGSDRVIEYGDPKNVWQFSFIVPQTKTASETDLADVKAFIAIVKRVNTFQWTDVDNGSAVHTVRIISNPIRWKRMGGRWFEITIDIREQ